MKIFSSSMSHFKSDPYQKANISDEQIIHGIINYDDLIIRSIYKEYYQRIKKMIYTFKNITLDPDDIFQEGLTRAIINIREGRFRGESSFLTYLNSICRNICLKDLSRKRTESIENQQLNEEEKSIDFEFLDEILQIRNQLEEKCKTIIDLRFGLNEKHPIKDLSFDEIATFLGLTTDNARQRFKRCLDKLREFVKNSKLTEGIL